MVSVRALVVDEFVNCFLLMLIYGTCVLLLLSLSWTLAEGASIRSTVVINCKSNYKNLPLGTSAKREIPLKAERGYMAFSATAVKGAISFPAVNRVAISINASTVKTSKNGTPYTQMGYEYVTSNNPVIVEKLRELVESGLAEPVANSKGDVRHVVDFAEIVFEPVMERVEKGSGKSPRTFRNIVDFQTALEAQQH